MTIKQRKQVTGTTEQINAYAGVEGQLVWNKTTKRWVGMSGTAGTNYPMASERHQHSIANVTNLQKELDSKANDATLQVDLTKIRQSITEVSSKVDGIGDTLSPTYAKKQTILDACDQAMNGANPVHAGDPTLDDIKSALATIQAQLGKLESRRYVKETGKSSDGNSWYRKWSDGWIEQGGRVKAVGYDSEARNVTFMVTMSNTNYFAVSNPVDSLHSRFDLSSRVSLLKSGGMTVKGPVNSNSLYTGECTWYVCGY